jgi:plasmid maintenance system antidote protein VapI
MASEPGEYNAGEAREDMRVGKTLIDRFVEGKKILRPEVAEAGIVVLDALIARLKNFRSGLSKQIAARRQEILDLDKQIVSVQPKYDKLKKAHDARVAERAQLQQDVDSLTGGLEANLAAASALLAKANRSHGTIRNHMAASLVDANRGFTANGAALPGREVNAMKHTVRAANTKAGCAQQHGGGERGGIARRRSRTCARYARADLRRARARGCARDNRAHVTSPPDALPVSWALAGCRCHASTASDFKFRITFWTSDCGGAS